MNCFDKFCEMAAKQPTPPLIIGPYDERSQSYAQVYQQIQSLMAQLKAQGVCTGDTIGLHYSSGPDEALLEAHPAIEEAHVYDERDDRLGEIPLAQVVKKSGVDQLPTADELHAFCLQHLASYKIPK